MNIEKKIEWGAKYPVIIICLFAIIIRFAFLWIKITLLLIILLIYLPIARKLTFCLLKTQNNISVNSNKNQLKMTLEH